jgi:4-alpha-glucanotransferase
MFKRGSGILLHVTSLPSRFGIGDLGPQAHKFCDFLRASGQRYWQVLPLNPINPVCGNSPYSSISAFAANRFLISPESLAEEGYLAREELKNIPDFRADLVEYEKVFEYKSALLRKAFKNFKKKKDKHFKFFCERNAYWLDDFAVFKAIKDHYFGHRWNDWPKDIRGRESGAVNDFKRKFGDGIDEIKFYQYIFDKQWSALKSYCNETNVNIIGDIPIYVSLDSADVWSGRKNFKLNSDGRPDFVAGVPPDYFSKTGQLWGNPVYDWDYLKNNGYDWWVRRMRRMLELYDIVRIDHFRGLVAFWQVRSGESTAVNGEWGKVPTDDFIRTLRNNFKNLPIIAEDLGMITEDVKKALKRHKLPGMKVLLFAFGEDKPDHPYLPHTYEKNCVAYIGTHDNNTVKGWLANEADEKQKERLASYAKIDLGNEEVNWELIKLLMDSKADLAVFQLQDVLGLDESSRMNTPSVASGNWQWRFLPGRIDDNAIEKLRSCSEGSKRL